MSEDALTGVIVVDKPAGWTSHDVVAKVRKIARTKKVGHLGTLDPLATGVLPLLLGRATRLAQFYGQSEKAYDAELRFGFSTSTYDREGEPTSPAVAAMVSPALLEPLLTEFRGTFEQMPPPFSAKKVQGRPAYQLARSNVAFTLAAVPVTVHELTLLAADGDTARLRVRCSTGTYVRSIVHDLGVRLGYGAHLTALRRTQSGEFTLQQAHPLPELEAWAREGALNPAVISPARLLPAMPYERVDLPTVGNIRQGKDFRVSPFTIQPDTRFVKALGPDGDLVAIGEARLPQIYHPVCVL